MQSTLRKYMEGIYQKPLPLTELQLVRMIIGEHNSYKLIADAAELRYRRTMKRLAWLPRKLQRWFLGYVKV